MLAGMPEVRRSEALTGPQIGTHRADRAIRDLAVRQHGVVARTQLLDAGLTAKVVRGRLARGQLLAVHRGVYAVGHNRLRREGFWMAAVLAVGPRAVLSHRAAAALHGVRPSNGSRIDVTTTTKAAAQAGIRVYRARSLDAADVTTVNAIPVTSVARTLVDLADVVPEDHLAKALNEAERQQLFDLRAIEAARRRTRGRRGPGPQRLAHALQELKDHGTTITRSPLEVQFIALIQRAGLTKPHTNAQIGPHEVDAYWPAHRLAVELDGWRHHNTRRDFQHDRAKDRDLTERGLKVIRFTHYEVTRCPAHVVGSLRRLGVR
jgi:predicted transcriptional regulator of viral defense system